MSSGGEGLELLIPPKRRSLHRIFTGNRTKVLFLSCKSSQICKIFAFDYEVVIVGKPTRILREALKKLQIKSSMESGEQSGIEFLISDALGRMWTGPRIFVDERMGVVGLSLFYSLERFVALILEKKEPLEHK